MKILYLIVGSIGLILSIIGLVIPIIPASPFLVIALYGFSKGSKRMHHFLIGLPFIKQLYQSLEKNSQFTLSQKIYLSLCTLPIAIVPVFVLHHKFTQILCVVFSLVTIAGIWLYHHAPMQHRG